MNLRLLIPTKKQFLSWTMLHRLGYISAVIGIPVCVIQLILWGIDAYYWLQPAPQILSVSDRLTIDQNPTRLEIDNVSIEKYDSQRDVVVFKLRNPSTVTAKNVRVDFYNNKYEKSKYSKGLRYVDTGHGIDIPAGQARTYRVAYKEDYERFFNPSDPGEQLLKVSKDINAKIPLELKNTICGDVSSCSFNTNGNSTIVNIKYGSIFGQKYGLITQFYNTFLDGEISKN